MVAGAATFNGVNQTTPLGTFASSIGTGTSASVSLSSATGEIVFDTVTAESVGSMTAGAGQTAHWNTFAGSSGAIGFGGASTEAGATSVNMSWSLGSSNIWAIGAVPIRPAAVSEITPTPSIIADLDAENEIYSYSGLGHYVLDTSFDGDRRSGEKDVTIFLISGSLEITQDFSESPNFSLRSAFLLRLSRGRKSLRSSHLLLY